MRLAARHSTLARRVVGVTAMLALLSVGAASAAPIPPGPITSVPAPVPVERTVPYAPQSTCDATVKPGARALQKLAMDHYGVGRNLGVLRGCAIGGVSEHKEGRAFDWGLNVSNPAEKAAGDAFTTWLTAPGPDDRPGYNARRLGVMYVIWNERIWSASSGSWSAYGGASPHTDHVHVSLSWNGAYMRTSWWTGSLVAQPPLGSIDAITTTDLDVTVQGWALDPDTSSSTDVHVYVDGKGVSVRADGSRPDVAATFGRGDQHGFRVTVPSGPGPHTVCAYAIDSDPTGHTLLGCRTVTAQGAAPIGAVDAMTVAGSTISVSGWTLDPDTVGPTEAHIYVDGVGVSVRADAVRADIGRAFGKGDRHGFQHTATVAPGMHEVCVYAINTGPGGHTLLTCRSVGTEAPPSPAPIGSLDSVLPSATGVTVAGWSLDPDTTEPTDVHVYVDGVPAAVRADVSRPDVAAAFGKGDRHGYTHTRQLAAGRHSVCAYAINTARGPHTLLGCRDFTVVAAVPPTGSVDSIVVGPGTVSVSGWALDPTTTASTEAHVYIDGVGVAVRADAPRPDVAAAFGKGDRHGFTHTRALPAGRHDVCVYAISASGSANQLLTCRTVDVPR